VGRHSIGLVENETNVTNSITCPNCKTRFVQVSKTKKTYQSTPQQFIGNDAGSLRQTQPVPAPRQLPSLPDWTGQSKTGQRVVQTGISCGLVAIAGASGPVICTVGLGVWFGSVVFGRENWDVVFRFFDRNKDGRVDSRDLREMTDWWRGGGDDEPVEPPPPDIVVSVASGSTVTRQRITGTTEEQWQKAAWIMASVTCKDGKFSRDRVGAIFGDNKEFGRVQQEMRTAGLLRGANRYTGYKLTPAGRAFLAEYRPSPTPDE